MTVKNIFFTDESVERQTTDSISENLTDSDLESNITHVEVSLRSSTKAIAKKEGIRPKTIAFGRTRSFSVIAFRVSLTIVFRRIRSLLSIASRVLLTRYVQSN